ncbi:hypothetical protein D3C81_203800 [compost metagenome]
MAAISLTLNPCDSSFSTSLSRSVRGFSICQKDMDSSGLIARPPACTLLSAALNSSIGESLSRKPYTPARIAFWKYPAREKVVRITTRQGERRA